MVLCNDHIPPIKCIPKCKPQCYICLLLCWNSSDSLYCLPVHLVTIIINTQENRPGEGHTVQTAGKIPHKVHGYFWVLRKNLPFQFTFHLHLHYISVPFQFTIFFVWICVMWHPNKKSKNKTKKLSVSSECCYNSLHGPEIDVHVLTFNKSVILELFWNVRQAFGGLFQQQLLAHKCV